MPISLAELIEPQTPDQVKAIFLATLAGIGPVVQVGEGAGTLTVAGQPTNNFDALIQIVAGGAPGTATFQFSFDDGNTWAGPYAVPANGVYTPGGAGISFTFAGTFVAGDVYQFQTIYPPFPTTDWNPGNPGRQFTEAESQVIADQVSSTLPGIAGSGFLAYASDKGAPNSWFDLLADQMYEVERAAPTYAQYLVVLTNATSAPISLPAVGKLIVANGLGAGALQFLNQATGSVPANSSLTVLFQAAQPGAAYNGQNLLLTWIQTPIPGLSASNPAPGIGAVSGSSGAGGTVAVTGAPTGYYALEVLLVTGGATGTATFQYSIDGGQTFSAPLNTGALVALPGTGLSLEFSGSFNAADEFTCTASNTSQVQQGTDLQSTSSMQELCEARWATIGGGEPEAAFLYWAQQASTEVAKVAVGPDLVVAGQVDVVVSGPSGPVSGNALSAVRNALKPLVMLPASLQVSNSTQVNVTVTGTVYVVTSMLASVQAAVAAALAEYFNGLPLEPTLELADIQGILRPQAVGGIPGILNYSQIALNGGGDLVLSGAATVAALVNSLTYVLQ